MHKILQKAAIIGAFALASLTHAAAEPHPGDPTKGGAGGRIIRVTTLAKSGPGSLAEALAAKGPRTVVFEVGGVIDLGRSTLEISEPYLTIAGQTAPSPGITIIKGGIDLRTHDVVVSHIRVMTGADGQARMSGWEADSFSTVAAHNVVVEHCSFLWGVDENMSASGPRFTGSTVEQWRAGTSHHIVFRDNLAAEGLANSSHPKGEHSKGSLIHDNATNIMFYRNVWAHNVERSPLVKGGAQVAMINNLIYNPGHRAVHYNLMNLEWQGQPYVTGEITAIGNVMRGGNDTNEGLPFLMLGGDGDLAYFGKDNRAVDRHGNPLPQFGRYGETRARLITAKAPLARVDAYSVLPSGEVETSVLQTAGARPWDRAPDDIRVLFFVAEGRGDIIDDESEVGGYPAPVASFAPFNEADWNLETMTPISGRYPGQKGGAQESLSTRDPPDADDPAMSAIAALLLAAAPPMAIVDELDTVRREPPPHGSIGMSTAWRISDHVPQPRKMEFRRRTLDIGAAIGEHPIAHDEVYYVIDGEGEVVSDGQRAVLKPGMTAYLYDGAVVGIWQRGDKPLALIIAYPVKDPVSCPAECTAPSPTAPARTDGDR